MELEALSQRYEDFWQCRNRTPILLLRGTEGEIPPVKRIPPTIRERWMDIEYLIERERNVLSRSFFLGDAFPLVNPNLGPDIFGASLGADLRFQETTSYSVPFVSDDWSEDFSFREDNYWWKKIKEITEAFVEDSKGDYLVGITDLHTGADGLVSIRGPENLCFDLMDQPKVFENSSKVLLPAFKKQFEQLCAITQRYVRGVSNWMGLYKKDPWYVTSSDFICMISEESFEAYEQYMAASGFGDSIISAAIPFFIWTDRVHCGIWTSCLPYRIWQAFNGCTARVSLRQNTGWMYCIRFRMRARRSTSACVRRTGTTPNTAPRTTRNTLSPPLKPQESA